MITRHVWAWKSVYYMISNNIVCTPREGGGREIKQYKRRLHKQSLWGRGGIGGAGAWENRCRTGTGDGRRKGGKRDLYYDGKVRDKFKKASFCYFSLRVAAPSLSPLFLCHGEGVATRRLSLFVTAYHPVKEIPCKQRFLSCMAFNIYEVIHVACLSRSC